MLREARTDKMIYLNHVDKLYPPNQYALRNFSLDVNKGEFLFVTGASGAGKTTLLKILIGELRASRGDVSVCGTNLKNLNRLQVSLLRRNIGVIFQDYKLLDNRTVLENVSFALEILGVEKDFRIKQSKRMLDLFGLGHRSDSYPRTLSGGEQQRVAIARAMISRPSLIIADEPTGNLDPDMSRLVFDILLEANNCGSTVLIASHNLNLIEKINKRTIVIDRGKLVGDFNAQ